MMSVKITLFAIEGYADMRQAYSDILADDYNLYCYEHPNQVKQTYNEVGVFLL